MLTHMQHLHSCRYTLHCTVPQCILNAVEALHMCMVWLVWLSLKRKKKLHLFCMCVKACNYVIVWIWHLVPWSCLCSCWHMNQYVCVWHSVKVWLKAATTLGNPGHNNLTQIHKQTHTHKNTLSNYHWNHSTWTTVRRTKGLCSSWTTQPNSCRMPKFRSRQGASGGKTSSRSGCQSAEAPGDRKFRSPLTW